MTALKYAHATCLVGKSGTFSYLGIPAIFATFGKSCATSRKRPIALVFYLGVRGYPHSALRRALVYFT